MNSVLKERKPPRKVKHSRPQSAWKRQGRYFYLRLLRMREHPNAIARGLAVGVFAGCFPLFGFQTIIGIGLAFLVKGNKLAAAAGTWVSNPLTYVPLFAFNYKIGKWLLGQYSDGVDQSIFNQSWESWSQLADLGTDFIVILFYGCSIVGAITAFITYFVSLRMLNRRYKR